jgi:hypothetical protein
MVNYAVPKREGFFIAANGDVHRPNGHLDRAGEPRVDGRDLLHNIQN